MADIPLNLTPRQLQRLRRGLQNPRRLLKRIGLVLLARAQRAFSEQRLGDVPWLQRGPSQGEPYINVAGALTDLNEGGQIKERRFQRRPALVDTGTLRRSLAEGESMSFPDKLTVAVGTTVPYAGVHQKGGQTDPIPVTVEAKQALAKQLRTGRRRLAAAAGRARAGIAAESLAAAIEEAGVQAQRTQAIAKLAFLFEAEELTIDVPARPFLGITDEDQESINELIEEEIKAMADGES